ncbi:amine oxidase [Tilletiaria anomala UBC 951]|uniref:Amine oxidase n=1 Tax=Tilletiaria anomala (strain ATCC 24038 / CBS 436.72 / UBC 951) TaxID=1037660 RepID=A0A066VBI0_TILAU|nr:amine oxidase [Tilletiaria anomala UBC 951]KDN37658.1 amine oxidase [Tilletiaria anomala UBC 951]
MAVVDTLIIGGGWAGLIAATRLSHAGKKVILLEARERIGGRAFTHTWTPETPADSNACTHEAGPSGKVFVVDFGCSWIHGFEEGNPARKLAEHYDIKANIPKPTTSKVIGPHGPLSEHLASKLCANLGAAQAAAAKLAQSEGPSLPDSSRSLADYLFSSSSPLYEGISSQGDKKLASDFARLLHVPLGARLEDIALRWTGFERNFAGTDAAPEGGFTRLITKIVEDATKHGAQIKTSQVVQQVKFLTEGNGSRVQVVSQDGLKYEAASVLCTIPLAVLKGAKGMFEPSLPERRKAVIDRVNVGALNKVLLSYDNPWWEVKTGSFTILPTTLIPADLQSASLRDIFSSSTLIVSSFAAPNGLPDPNPSLLAYVGAEHGRAIERFTRQEVAEALHAYLFERIGSKAGAIEQPKHSFYSRWNKQEFTRGATTTPVVVGENHSPLDFVELGRPLWGGALNFAGEHTEMDHRGSIAGAIVSGEREAQRIVDYLERQSYQAQKL